MGKNVGRHDGVVLCGEDERFHPNSGKIRRSVGLFVIIQFVTKTIQGRDDKAVEVVKSPRAPHSPLSR